MGTSTVEPVDRGVGRQRKAPAGSKRTAGGQKPKRKRLPTGGNVSPPALLTPSIGRQPEQITPHRGRAGGTQPAQFPPSRSSASPQEEQPRPATPNPPELQANIVKRAVVPATMATALGLNGQMGASGYRLYLDGLLKEAGGPVDPVEVMLLEQLAMCHLRSMQLHGQAGQAEGLEAMQLYNSAAVRLAAEFRKMALALKDYRNT